MKPFHSTLLLLLALWPVCSYSDSAGEQANRAYRIGAILPLSGDAAALGAAARNGMILGVEAMSGSSGPSVEVLFEDDGLVTHRSIGAFRKLQTVNQIDAAICWSSSTCHALAPLAHEAKIPLVAIASDSKVSREKEFVVSLWVTPEAEAELAFKEAMRRGYRKIAAALTVQDGVMAVRDAFQARASGNIEILRQEDFPSEVKDFRPFLSRVKSEPDLDAIMMILMPGQIGAFAKQVRQAGITVPLFGFETLEDEGEVKVSGGALVGAWYATGAPGTKEFVAQYRERFPGSLIVTASNGYDAVLLLGKGAASANGDPHKVAEYLRTVKDFTGASGTFSATGDNRFSLPAVLKVVANDGFPELGP